MKKTYREFKVNRKTFEKFREWGDDIQVWDKVHLRTEVLLGDNEKHVVHIDVPIPKEIAAILHEGDEKIVDAHKRLAEHLKDFPDVHVVQYNILPHNGTLQKVSTFREGVLLDEILESKEHFPKKHLKEALAILEQLHAHLTKTNMYIGDGEPRNILLSIKNNKTNVTLIDQPVFFKAEDISVSQIIEFDQFEHDKFGDLYAHTLLPSIDGLKWYLEE